MVGRRGIYVTKDTAKKGAVLKTVMNLQGISLPAAEFSVCRRDSCCLQLVGLSVSEMNHVLRHECKLDTLTVVTSYVPVGSQYTERERESDAPLCPIYCL